MKTEFIKAVQSEITSLAKASERLIDLQAIFFDRGYNSGGSSPITNGDLGFSGLNTSAFDGAINLITQLSNFRNNAAVTQADWFSNLNNVRNDV